MNGNSSGGNKGIPKAWRIPLIILAVSLIAAAVSYPFLPMQIPIHWGMDGTRYAGKAFIFAIALLPALLFVLIRAKYGRR